MSVPNAKDTIYQKEKKKGVKKKIRINISNPLDSHRPLRIQLIRIPLMTLLLTVIQPHTPMILEQPMPCAEMAAAEPAVSYDALNGFSAGWAGRRRRRSRGIQGGGIRTNTDKATSDAFAAVRSTSSHLASTCSAGGGFGCCRRVGCGIGNGCCCCCCCGRGFGTGYAAA